MVNKLSPAKKAWITRKIKSGKSKYQISIELDISPITVWKYTRKYPGHPIGNSGIRGNTLSMLQDIMSNGYNFCLEKYRTSNYKTLKKYFPMLQITHYQHKSIIFLEEKAHVAAKAYLEQYPHRIMSYQELKTITKLFDTDLSKREKNEFIGKKRHKKH